MAAHDTDLPVGPSTERSGDLFEQMAAANIVINPDGIILSADPAVREVLGFNPEQMENRLVLPGRSFSPVPLAVIPAEAGIHLPATHWIPASAGMTDGELPLG